MHRRDALKLGLGAGLAAAAAALAGRSTFVAARETSPAATTSIAITPVDLELAPGVCVHTIAFDGSVSGSPIARSTIQGGFEFRNETDSVAVVHSSAFAEPLLSIPPRAHARAFLRTATEISSVANFKPYRAYCTASGSCATGTILVGPEHDTGLRTFDQLQVLSINRWQFRPRERSGPRSRNPLARDYVSFNDRLLIASEPIKVRCGDRVRFHFSNSSSTRAVTLALPQHRFMVLALDGYCVPTPRHVDRLYLGPAESVDALVTMDRPGRWVLGTTHRQDRCGGLGRLIEYAGAVGTPVDNDHGIADWDYSWFGSRGTAAVSTPARLAAPPLTLHALTPVDSRDERPVDPTPQTAKTPLEVSAGERYRLVATNVTRDPQLLQLLGHDVELVAVAGQRTAGVRKDVVTLPSFTRLELEFVARTSKVYLAHAGHVSLYVPHSRWG